MNPKRRVRPESWVALNYFGEALLHFADTGDRSRLDKSTLSLRGFAKCVIAISNGADAREVFGQAGRPGRQSQSVFNSARALAYWKSRCVNPGDVDLAIEKAFAVAPGESKPSRDSIMRFARKHRDRILQSLKRQGIDVAPLLKYLKRKSKRGIW
jgi:hypothetical protein